MGVPSITDLKMWVGQLFTKDDWDFNFSQLVGWLADGSGDLVVRSLKASNGVDLDGGQIYNLGPATSGNQPISLDQAETLLNRNSNYYPFSVASGKVDSNGNANYLQIQKDAETNIITVTVLAGSVNPDLVCVSSDGTIESITQNTVLTVPTGEGVFHIIKEKENAITITQATNNKVTIGKKAPSSTSIGDYFLDNSTVPFKGYKYTADGRTETPFCYLGYVTVGENTYSVTPVNYNDNNFDLNINSLNLAAPDYSAGIEITVTQGFDNYTALDNGYISCFLCTTAATTASGTGHVYVNGSVALATNPQSGDHNGEINGQFVVSKGDVITSDHIRNISTNLAYFYPMKGVSND